MRTGDLIGCARYLLDRPELERTQADLDRAASTHYYALFHELAQCCADFMMGPCSTGHGRRAWQQVYRALEHELSKAQCKKKDMVEKFPEAIRNFANHFVAMQERRHQCDYDPLVMVELTQIEFDIANSATILEAFRSAPEIDKRAFCAYVLFSSREDPVRRAEEDFRKRMKRVEEKERQRSRQGNKDNRD